jgi:phytoene synthase
VRDDYRECRRVIARHSKSFDLASRIYPAARRDDVAALYAWCRTCDDAIDLAPREAHREAMDALRRDLGVVYSEGSPSDPVYRCFQDVVRRRRIPFEYPSELLAGMRMDTEDTRFETLDDLLVYCWRVAGTVGLMMCHVMGVSDAGALRHAAHLGIAMQLTNISRDVQEDWALGRLYVPYALLPDALAASLRGRGLAPGGELPRGARDAFAPAVRQLLSVAQRYYASADLGMAYLAPRSALAVRTARLFYSEIGRRIEARGFDVTRGRAFVPAARKLQLAGSALRGFLSDRRRWPAVDLVSPGHVLERADAIQLV